MVAFGVIGILALVLIYFVLRAQNLQRELNQIKHALKSVDAQSKYSLGALVTLSGQLQNSYLARLEALKKHALINQEDYDVAHFVLSRVEFIVMQCCEHKATVEEALKKALAKGEISLEQVNQLIAKQPPEVRIPWCKNTIGGFISACHNLTSKKPATAKDKQTEQA